MELDFNQLLQNRQTTNWDDFAKDTGLPSASEMVDLSLQNRQNREADDLVRNSVGRRWEEIEPVIKQQFPKANAERIRSQFDRQNEHFQQQRNSPGGRLIAAIEQERLSGDDEWGATRWGNTAIRRMPFIGQVQGTADAVFLRNAAVRIRDGEGTSEDYERLARHLVDAERSADRSVFGDVLNVVSHIPGFALEFLATKGAFTAGRAAATRIASSVAGRAAEGLAGRAAIGAAGYVAGTAAQTLANPQLIAERAANRQLPTIAFDQQGRLNITDNRHWSNVPAGFLDAWIEMASERAGDVAGKALGRTRWGQLLGFSDDVGRTGIRAAMAQIGQHGPVMEMFEERLGEGLRGLAGLTRHPDGSRDFGVIEQLLDSETRGPGLRQMFVEMAAFAAVPVAAAAANRALRGKGLSDAAATQRINSLIESMSTAQTREEAVVDAMAKNDPLRNVAQTIADVFPEVRQPATQEPTQITTEPAAPTIAPEAQASAAVQTPTVAAPEAGTGQNQGVPADQSGVGTATSEVNVAMAGSGVPGYEMQEQPVEPSAQELLSRYILGDKSVTTDQISESAGLDPGEATVFFARMSMLEAEMPSLKETGKTLGVTKQRAQQLEKSAMAKLGLKGSMEVVRKKLKEMQVQELQEQVTEPAQTVAAASPTAVSKFQIHEKAVSEYDSLVNEWMNETDPAKADALAKQIGTFSEQKKGVLFFGGPRRALADLKAQVGDKVISPYELIKTAYAWFRAPYSVGKVTGNHDAAYLEFVDKVTAGSQYAGDTIRMMHELAHHIQRNYKFPIDIGELAQAAGNLDVVKGFVQFDYEKNRIFGPEAIQEGFAEWFRQRTTGEDIGSRTSEQEAAAAFGEKWLDSQGLGEIADRIRIFSDNYRGASPELRARLEISPRGQQPGATGLTKAETAKVTAEEMLFKSQQALDDNLRILTLAQQASGKTPAKGRDLRTVFSALRIMAHGWDFAGNGMTARVVDAKGNVTWEKIGEDVGWLIRDLGFTEEDLRPEGAGTIDAIKRWLGFTAPMAGSKLDAAIMMIYSVREVERGLQMKANRKVLLDVIDGKPVDAEATTKLMAYLERFGEPADVQWYKTPDLLSQLLTTPLKAEAYRTHAESMLEEGNKLTGTVATRQAKIAREYLDDLQAKKPEWYANAVEATRRMAVLNDNILEGLVSVGWYTQEEAQRLRKKYPDYIPIFRVVEGEEFKPNREMRRGGSGRQIVGPIAALQGRYAEAQYIYAKQIRDFALMENGQQQAGPAGIGGYFVEVDDTPEVRRTDLKETLDALGIPKEQHDAVIDILGVEILHAIQPKQWNDAKPNLYRIRVDGKRITLQIDNKDLYNLLTDMQVEANPAANMANMVASIWPFKAISKTVTFGATRAMMTFNTLNPFRDPVHLVQNEGLSVATLEAWASGQKGAAKDAAMQLFGQEQPIFDTLYADATGQQLRQFAYTHKGKGATAFRKLYGESSIEKPIWLLHKVDDFLSLVGFAEQGPRRGTFYRALAEMGYTRDVVDKALQSDPMRTPIPMHDLFYAVQRSAESTTDFTRGGVFTKEFNKISPFFSPSVAAMSQEIRNWEKARQEGFVGPKSKAMIGTLAIFVGLELFHWLRFKDDEWYKNLPAHLRYNWWVLGQTADGGTFGFPKPQGILRLAGAYLTETLRTASGSAPRFGMANSSVIEQGTPRLLPIGLAESKQIWQNKDWRGMPIVPRRDEFTMDNWEKFRTHQLPYLMEQFTGGLASGRVLRLPTEAFKSSRAEPNLPVAEYYDELQRLTGERQTASRLGRPFTDEARYQQLHRIERRMQDLAREARGERLVNGRTMAGEKPSAERLRQIRLEQVQLASRVMIR